MTNIEDLINLVDDHVANDEYIQALSELYKATKYDSLSFDDFMSILLVILEEVEENHENKSEQN